MLDKQKPNYDIKTIVEIFKQGNLTIPEYQRPYKWTVKNTNQLIDDILLHQEKSKYRLGTMVVHDNNGELEIVDGQQRFITILSVFVKIVVTFFETKPPKSHSPLRA